jgi:hypothetical protein
MTGIVIFKLQNGSHTNVQALAPLGRRNASMAGSMLKSGKVMDVK